MPNKPAHSSVQLSERLYQRLLRLYPTKHRLQYGPLMAQLFRDQCREAFRNEQGIGLLKLWWRVAFDSLRTSVTEHLSQIERIRYMLNKSLFTLSKPLIARNRSSVAVAVLLLVFFGASAVTYILPLSYKATARITVAKRTDTSHSIQDGYDPTFIPTEIERIRSKAVLYPVVERFYLDPDWPAFFGADEALGSAEVVRLLLKQMHVSWVKNTRLVEIQVYGPYPREAAAIANEIAESYLRNVARKKDIVVDLIDRAEPMMRPVRPNVPLNLTVGLIAGLAASSLVLLIPRPPKATEEGRSFSAGH